MLSRLATLDAQQATLQDVGGTHDQADDSSRWGLRQLPGLAVFVSVSAGTCWDRFWAGDLRLYLAVVVGSAWGWCCSGRRTGNSRWGTCWAMLAVAGSAAVWHHGHWHWYPSDEIARFASSSTHGRRLVAVQGRWDSCVQREVGELDRQVRIMGRLRVSAIEDAGVWRPASGRLQVVIRRASAGRGELHAGDLVCVTGELSRVAGPANPGEFDRREFLRAARVLARLDVANEGCVRHLRRAGFGTPGWFFRWSDRADEALQRHLDADSYPVGAALLLGRREHLSSDQQDRFLRTGTVHLLAISGFHVGVLASGLLLVTRSGIVSERVGMVLVMAAAWLFAEATGMQAPVMRAHLLVQFSGIAWWLRKHAPPVNSLCWSAVLVWLRCPSDLFQVGAQLSFLAVAILIHLQRVDGGGGDAAWERLLDGSRPWPIREAGRVLKQCRQGLGVSIVVWSFTLPLVVEQFHVVAMWAAPLNLLLWLPLVAALFSGFAVLLLDPWCSSAASIPAAVCRLGLLAFEKPILWADQLPYSRFWCAGVGWQAVMVFYGVWSVYWVWPPWRRHRSWFIAVSSMALVAGIAMGEGSRRLPVGHVRCTFLSVGHGACVVLQFPSGKTWLYDCGRLAAGRSAVDAVSNSLWGMRISRIERVVLSHADADHFSLLPGLLERFRVGEVVTGPGFWRDGSAGTQQLGWLLRQQRIERRTCVRGESWEVDDRTKVEVLHPSKVPVPKADNANSVVLLVRNGPFSIVLPGDLEGHGTKTVLELPMGEVTVALAPHHGSCQEDPCHFLDWCRPRWLVVSGRGGGENEDEGWQAWGRAGVESLHTAYHGAICVEFGLEGIRVDHFRMSDAAE